MEKYNISNLLKSDILDLHGDDEYIYFIGSGVSIWEPTNFPTGIEFSNSLFDQIFPDENSCISPKNLHFAKKLFNKIPFEVINGLCPCKSKILNMLRDEMQVANPNHLHYFLMQSLANNPQNRAIITPNYDLAFENTILNSKINIIKRITLESDTNNLDPCSNKILFKIHGSFDDQSGKSLVYELSQEGRLPGWKRGLFHNLIKGRTIIIIGYSGIDFDICPEIALAEPRKIIWNFLDIDETHLPANLSLISKQIETILLIGDMRSYFYTLSNDTTFKSLAINKNPCQIKKKYFSEDEVHEWRNGILQSLSFVNEVIPDLEERLKKATNPKQKANILSKLGEAYATNGRYRTAAKCHESAANLTKTNPKFFLFTIDQLLAAGDAWRCYGWLHKTIINYFIVRRNLKKIKGNRDFLAKCNRLEILIMGNLFALIKIFKFPFIKIFKSKATVLIKETILIYIESGEHYSINQLVLWANRFDIDINQLESLLGIKISTAYLKYQSLSFPMGEMMALREENNNPSFPRNKSNLKEIYKYLFTAKKLGINPEIWKLLLLLLDKYKIKNTNRLRMYFWKYFFKCEYSPSYRLIQLLSRN